jgi:hypothetical protein
MADTLSEGALAVAKSNLVVSKAVCIMTLPGVEVFMNVGMATSRNWFQEAPTESGVARLSGFGGFGSPRNWFQGAPINLGTSKAAPY